MQKTVQNSILELDESVTKATEIRQKQHAEFVTPIANNEVVTDLVKVTVIKSNRHFVPSPRQRGQRHHHRGSHRRHVRRCPDAAEERTQRHGTVGVNEDVSCCLTKETHQQRSKRRTTDCSFETCSPHVNIQESMISLRENAELKQFVTGVDMNRDDIPDVLKTASGWLWCLHAVCNARELRVNEDRPRFLFGRKLTMNAATASAGTQPCTRRWSTCPERTTSSSVNGTVQVQWQHRTEPRTKIFPSSGLSCRAMTASAAHLE